ncbi:MAG TPA: energy-coupled thiamine transporter ThiT [Clostridia bacterium]|nr:energy-coupled thiamine transporter ThiT [Clostridia bacterium]
MTAFLLPALRTQVGKGAGEEVSNLETVTAIFEDLSEITATTWYILCGLLTLSVIGLAAKSKARVNVQALVYAGLLISIAFVLSYIRLYRWPQGGSITPASMLPLFVYAYIFGPRAGITAGAAYGLLQLIQDPYILHPVQVLLDYIIAFAALGLAGFARHNLSLGILLGGFGRFFSSFLSGVIFFASYAPEGMSPIVYSLLVNGLIIGTETLVCLAVSLVPQVRHMLATVKSGMTAKGYQG